MTDDPTTDPVLGQADPATALASAYLDAEASDAEVARVESDPALLARVAELEALRDRLAVPTPPRDLVDDHVAAALAAYSTPIATPDTGTPADELTARRARQGRRWYERIPLGAVAAAVVVIALVGAISQIDTGDSDDMAADTASEALESTDDAGDDSGDDSGDAAGSGGDDSAADGDAGAESPAAESDTFGADEQTNAEVARLAFSDVDALADHLAARFDAPAPTTSTTSPSTQSDATVGQTPAGCALDALPGVDQREITAIEPAVIAGQEVTALVITGDGRRLVVVDDATCDVIDDRAL